MHSLILILLLAAAGQRRRTGGGDEDQMGGVCEAVYWEKLTCPYEMQHEGLLRVWCRQSSADCCSGFTFSHTQRSVDGGRLKVSHDSHSFTVEVMELNNGDGVYWCGLLTNNETIIKLAETYFHSFTAAYIWSLTRWILMPLLPLVTVFTNVYARAMTKCKKGEEPDDGYDTVGRAWADPQYENAAAFSELE